MGPQTLLSDRTHGNLFIDNLYHYRREGRYLLHEFVLMKDHFHLLVTVDGNTSIERAVQFIKGGFSYRAKKELDFRSAV